MFLFVSGILPAQTTGKPERTPEQEAEKQTETMQRELDLTPEQATLIHDINLKYAEERQQTNTRAEAMKRMLHKNEDYKRVLTEEQYQHLQSKRVERRTRPLENSADEKQRTTSLQSQRPQPARSVPTTTERIKENTTPATRQSAEAAQENRSQTTSIRINSTSTGRPSATGSQALPQRNPTTPTKR